MDALRGHEYLGEIATLGEQRTFAFESSDWNAAYSSEFYAEQRVGMYARRCRLNC